ncbi:MAG TPA: cytochrome c [Aliidongia sp.]|uniref:c-type cytochrome n=1 Tax=Aliidongia sp. TaxID=1914230 RepID=UPI002DDCCADD|nr:cytochrome c [Aliidongia sp.]HEV2678178.1 cytochrome c [Aliidongia sp.]
MQTWRWKFSLGAAAALAASIALMAAVKADDLASVVAERQAGMKAMGGKLKEIKAFAESGAGQAEASADAAVLVATAKSIPGWFPVGSGLDSFSGKTAAKPEIWNDQAKFKAIAATFQADTVALQQAIAAGDKAGASSAFEAMGREGCGACHGAFRAKT